MRMSLCRRVLGCVMIGIMPAAMFAADTGAAMLYTNGTTWLNGAGIPALATHAGELTVTPASNDWTDFEVKDVDGTIHIAARKGDVLIADETGTTTLPHGQQMTREESSTNKKKKKRAAAAGAAAHGPILDSPYAIGAGIAAAGGITAWVLMRGDDPVSPVKPK